jgi:hypothetical protein
MTHRYNTRFQLKKAAEESKKAAEAKKAAESNFTREQLLAFTVVFPNKNAPNEAYSSEKDAEIKVIKLLLTAAEQQSCRFHRITLALKLFYYLEHHHSLLRTHLRFRDIALQKTDEFIQVALSEKRLLDATPITNYEYYKSLCRTTVAAELLMDSCIRVRTIIQNF